MKTITAKFAACTQKDFKTGKTFNFPARETAYTQDDAGRWSHPVLGAVLEIDVIDDCKKATNWAEIKAAHFPMVGFHS